MTFKHPDFRGFKSTRFSRLFSVLALETADFTTNIIYCYLLLLAHYTTFSPMALYLLVKMLDFGKVAIAQYELKREKWVVNLAKD